MTTNDEGLRPRRNYDNAQNERHASNRDYNNERRGPRENSGYNNSERRYNDGSGYNNSDRRNNEGSGYNNSDRRYNNNNRQSSGDYRQSNSGGNYSGGGYSGGNTGNDDGTRKRRPRVGDRERVPYNNNNNQRDRGGYGGNSDQGNRYGGGSRSYNNNNRGGGGGYNPNGPRNTDRPQLIKNKKKIFKQIKYKENADPNAPIRLNKYLANAGVASRREADEFIQAGVVKVNGQIVTELGTKITRADEVMFHDQPVRLESKVYVLLNKPKGFVTTTDDPENRKTVMELVKSACSERIYPVGRLDRATSGVLLLTNDGDLASKLTHPKYEKRKIYQVWLDKPVAMEDMQTIADGIELEDGEIHADAISYVTEEDLSQIGIEIHSGRNRVVRRIFEKLGYRVTKLDRVYFAGLTKKNLSRGKWRYLSEKEVNMLRMGAFD